MENQLKPLPRFWGHDMRHMAFVSILAIYGIWFYEANECKNLHALLTSLVEKVKRGPEPPNSVNIMHLLTKARAEFSQVCMCR